MRIKTLLVLAALSWSSIARAQEPEKEAENAQKEVEALKGEEETDTLNKYWTIAGNVTLSGQEVSLTNWAAGGSSAFSGSGLLSVHTGYRRGSLHGTTTLTLHLQP